MDRAELQAIQLAAALGLGLGLGFFYDVYRVWFRQLRGRFWPALGDIVWWLVALGLAFVGLYHINGAELRLPVLVLAAAGVCLYMGLLSPLLFGCLGRLLLGLWHLLAWLGGCFGGALALLLSPLVWLVELFFRLTLFIWHFWQKIWHILVKIGSFLLRPWRRLAHKLHKSLKKPAKKVDFDEPDDI